MGTFDDICPILNEIDEKEIELQLDNEKDIGASQSGSYHTKNTSSEEYKSEITALTLLEDPSHDLVTMGSQNPSLTKILNIQTRITGIVKRVSHLAMDMQLVTQNLKSAKNGDEKRIDEKKENLTKDQNTQVNIEKVTDNGYIGSTSTDFTNNNENSTAYPKFDFVD